ncbi:outer dynein arm-docking complex subunit 3 isoform X1 [Euwallacea fornicatus]|uniref:outer dynein arm-docking complex subunit 3 isoform X1 n=1 Tax=Euwallacea fornicatus TaxID=995702 RepID=UPI0033900A2C
MNEEDALKLNKLNKKILEIKRKIQLSEGQRRALFEDCEAERKSNVDEILFLKKEVSKLVVVLHESVSHVAKNRLQNSRLEEILGPLSDKVTCNEAKEILDLQIIDLCKKLDLLRYKIRKRRNYIVQLGEEYEKLVSKQEKKELELKVDKPVSKSSQELQNNIHAVEVQIREAVHIKNKYSDIRRSLKNDSAKFESRIKSLEEELQQQSTDVNNLQKILEEAMRRKGRARGNLLKEEKLASSGANERELAATEGRRLVNERKSELEKLERRLFITGKLSVRQEPEGVEADVEDDSASVTPPHPVENKAQELEFLKRATGGTTTQEVLERFQGQKETEKRLNELRDQLETEKKSIENNMETLRFKLEGYKYSESREAEKKSGEMDRLQSEILVQKSKSESYKKEKSSIENALASVLSSLHSLRLLANPKASTEHSDETMWKLIVEDIKVVVEKYERCRIIEKTEEEDEGQETAEVTVIDESLPTPYNGLIRRAPQPQTMTSPGHQITAAGSDEEEEVPSRSFLKRQAQLVIDAKSRRRNLRIQLPKRN